MWYNYTYPCPTCIWHQFPHVWKLESTGDWSSSELQRLPDRAPRPCITTVTWRCYKNFKPMGAQLPLKAALPLAKSIATAWDHFSNTGPWIVDPVVVATATCLSIKKKKRTPSQFIYIFYSSTNKLHFRTVQWLLNITTWQYRLWFTKKNIIVQVSSVAVQRD